MTPDQFQQMAQLLKEIAIRPYTLTGAADWQILVWLVGLFQAVMFAVLGAMWIDLRTNLSSGETRWQKALDNHARECEIKSEKNSSGIEKLWDALAACKDSFRCEK